MKLFAWIALVVALVAVGLALAAPDSAVLFVATAAAIGAIFALCLGVIQTINWFSQRPAVRN
ncbi:MAG: hypothetical protein ACJ72D_20700 [Marmoricola sp.]